ncbi:MAG: dh protein [Parachlamydiales bacterium]|nr:dh protein [Parachlamydiales bacterium]
MNQSTLETALLAKIEKKSAVIAFLGFGYVGSHLGKLIAKKGFNVIGILRDCQKARAANAEKNPRLRASCDPSQLAAADIVIITVPTLIDEDKHPDLKPIQDAAALIQKHLKKGQLIILESTVSPGMTQDLIIKPLENDGWRSGVDFFAGYSPERIDPGNLTYTIENTPKIVAGKDPSSLNLTKTFYEKIVDRVVCVSSIEVAEFSKMLENNVRFVLINLMNEMQDYAVKKDINLWEVIDAAATKPFGYFPVYPGPGIGGHCIPVNFYYLLEDAKRLGVECPILKECAAFHKKRIAKIVDRAFEIVKTAHPRIFILGVSIKPESNNIAQSIGLKLLKIIEQKGGTGAYHDPLIPKIDRWNSEPLTNDVLEKQDLFLIVTPHREIDFSKLLTFKKPVIDTKNVFPKSQKGIYRL